MANFFTPTNVGRAQKMCDTLDLLAKSANANNAGTDEMGQLLDGFLEKLDTLVAHNVLPVAGEATGHAIVQVGQPVSGLTVDLATWKKVGHAMDDLVLALGAIGPGSGSPAVPHIAAAIEKLKRAMTE